MCDLFGRDLNLGEVRRRGVERKGWSLRRRALLSFFVEEGRVVVEGQGRAIFSHVVAGQVRRQSLRFTPNVPGVTKADTSICLM